MKLAGILTLAVMSAIFVGMGGSTSFSQRAPVSVLSLKPVISDESDSTISPGSASGVNPDDVDTAAEMTLCDKISRLESGRSLLQQRGQYTARIQKREVVYNELLDEHEIFIKCKQEPFSVYLNWITGDPGREVIYVEGRDSGKMIAHDGGWKARIPALYLSPDSRLAMRDARYPVTTAGFMGLIEIMLGVHRDDIQRGNVAACLKEEHVIFEGRDCDQFTTTYASADSSPIYRKSVTLIDREWSLPLNSRHFEWPQTETGLKDDQLDETTLIESYTFSDINFDCSLSDHDFDRSNPEYHFR